MDLRSIWLWIFGITTALWVVLGAFVLPGLMTERLEKKFIPGGEKEWDFTLTSPFPDAFLSRTLMFAFAVTSDWYARWRFKIPRSELRGDLSGAVIAMAVVLAVSYVVCMAVLAPALGYVLYLQYLVPLFR